MTSSNGNIFRVTAHLWGESAGHWWIPLTKASDAEFGVETNGWANYRDAGDLIRHGAHCDVTGMERISIFSSPGHYGHAIDLRALTLYNFQEWSIQGANAVSKLPL